MRIAANEAAKILGVAVGTKGKELKSALRRAIKENHPDVVKDDGSRLQRVREAFAALDPDKVPDNWNLEPHAQGAAYRRATSPGSATGYGNVGSWSSPSAQRKAAQMERERQERNARVRGGDLRARGFVENLMSEQMDNQVFQSAPGQHQWRGTVPTATMDWYKAVTNIRVREQPSVESPAIGVIRQGETIQVNAELAVTGQKFLKLKNKPGWVFQRGISGEWEGKQILVKA